MSSSSFELFNLPNISKIEKLLNDSSYRESIEISTNFNTRLCLERKLRMPFLDPQTGVAQNHSNLYMKKSQRMPGLREGQIYTYPSNRWRKSKRQYLTKLQYIRPFSNFKYRADCTNSPIPVTVQQNNSSTTPHPTISNTSASTSLNLAIEGEQSDFQALIDESNSLGADTDSKDSQNLKDELPKDWFYDDSEINDIEKDDISEQDDDDFDYNLNGYKRKRKRPKAPSTRKKGSETSERKGRSSGGSSAGGPRRGRRKNPSSRNNKSEATSESNNVEVNVPVEPPSFESIEHDLNLNENSSHSHDMGFGNYRKYL